MSQNEQFQIKEFDQAISVLDAIRQGVEAGEIMSLTVVCETTDGQMRGACTATQNQFAVAGYMLTWALRRLGFAQHDDVRAFIKEAW